MHANRCAFSERRDDIMRFKDKVALITGANKGIGRAAALALAREGAKVALIGRDDQEGAALAENWRREGLAALWLRADVSREAEVEAAVARTVARWGRLDVLVNNAGIYVQGDVLATSRAQWDAIMAVNLTGAFLCAKYAVPPMIKGGGGSIVNVSSEAGLVGIANQVAYNVSKAALIALTRSLALDFAAQNIRANCVCPGTTLTPLVEAAVSRQPQPKQALERLGQVRPAGRLGTPEEIAEAIAYFAADTSRYTTGAVLSVDGGYTAQ
jgi:NAD(P)-dependent dehydrogenase (short-subunit alcohol dehydrogenase family)